MMIFNIQKCILNYYTSVKVGSYSIETICTGSYSIETLFFWHENSGFLFYRNTLYIYIYICIYIYTAFVGSCLIFGLHAFLVKPLLVKHSKMR